MNFLQEGWMKIASAAIGLMVASGGAGYQVFQWHDQRYALSDMVQEAFDDLRTDLSMVEMRTGQKIQSDRIFQIRQRMWQLEDRNGHDHSAWPSSVQEEYRQLEVDLEDAKRKLDRIEQRYNEIEQQAPNRQRAY